ncbi:hypothetical protein PVAND_016870 [Polypedilum vanderplanki]|uniref:DUF659 domain-containing protein n=1 Tax=Polypedilum vanderplanki TaxID=319348 RepID=A0A9J6BGH3_POLVA|nr:hypothetical protein PVAND_016870 [Polypedilum vanderplanki]
MRFYFCHLSQPSALSSDSTSQKENQTLNGETKKNIDMKLANFSIALYSLRLVESEAFKEFVKALNPSYASVIPCAKALSGSLLDQHFNKCSTTINEILESHTNLTLLSDGWTNIRGVIS